MENASTASGMAQYAFPSLISLIVAIITAVVAVWRQKESLRHEFDLQRDRLRTELKLEFAIETAIRELLSDPQHPQRKRTFDAIKKRLDIFEDDRELRQYLVRAGAVRFVRDRDGAELWGIRELVDRNGLWETGSDDD